MNITLISIYDRIWSCGITTISSYLKKKGYDIQIFFLLQDHNKRYDNKILDELVNLSRKSDLIGISVISNFFENSVQVTKKLKKELDIPIIWGGVHPTVKPEECIEYADILILGEGEETLSDLLKNMKKGLNYHNIQGIWFKDNKKIIKNKIRPLIKNLDLLPAPDFGTKDHYILDEGHIRKMDNFLLEKYIAKSFEEGVYHILGSRGCLYNCSYCINNFEWKNFSGQKRYRKKSPQNIIAELFEVTKNFSFIKKILVNDDNFFGRSIIEIEEFCKEYKKIIGLPLMIYGINPLDFSEKKLRLCIDAGLKRIRMGIETGSERGKKLYRRNYSNQKVIEVTRIINKFQSRMEPPLYDFIIDNPWEEEDDMNETLSLVKEIPKPYQLNLHSLIFYPGTEIYEKAKKEGIIKDDLNDVYRNDFNNFKNMGYKKKLELLAR